MKIAIPEEYIGHFQKETMWLKLKDAKHCATKDYAKVFITRGRGGALLLLNEEECNELRKGMEGAQEKLGTHGLARFINASIHTSVMTNREIEIPEHLASWLEGDDRTITREKMGLLVR